MPQRLARARTFCLVRRIGTGSDASKLTFTCYGSKWLPDPNAFGETGQSYNEPRSRHEKELAKSERPEEKLIAMR